MLCLFRTLPPSERDNGCPGGSGPATCSASGPSVPLCRLERYQQLQALCKQENSLRKTRYQNPFQEHSAKNRCLLYGIPQITLTLRGGTGRQGMNSCP